MNAIDLLEKQHRKIEEILKRLETARSGQQSLVTELATTLGSHSHIEEQIFYPAARRVMKKNGIDIVLESYEEHAVVTLELERLAKSGIKDEMFKARCAVIKELVMTHVQKEESELLPKVRKLIDKRTLDKLGQQMQALFDETVDEGYETILQREKRQSAVRASKATQARR